MTQATLRGQARAYWRADRRHRKPATARAPLTRRGDAGVGVIGTSVGILVFLAFLLFAVQLLFNLYAASVVTSVAYDGASNVASAGADSPAARAAEEARMREILGRYGDRVSFDWSTQDGNVALRVRAENPSLLLPVLGGTLPFTEIDREVVVRVEELQP